MGIINWATVTRLIKLSNLKSPQNKPLYLVVH